MPPSVDRQVVTWLKRIVAATPYSRESSESRQQLEHVIMRVLKGEGLRGVEQVLRRGAENAVLPLKLFAKPRGGRSWAAVVTDAGGELQITVLSLPGFKSVSVQWTALRKPVRLTPRQQRQADVQEAFYARYNAAWPRAYASPPQRISAEDRRILLVGEFEADVNNGGFSQYLSNKGRARAKETARILAAINAPKTAALLSRALASEEDADLHALDDKFYRSREDLATLSMQALDRK